MIANVLSIAGTDPTGGAGIQADLKTFSALGSYGMAAITAVVAQNTQGVRDFLALDPAFVSDQIDAVFDDVRVDAVKIGMVANAAIANVIAERLTYHNATNIVLDPVMVAKSGDPLLTGDAVAAIRDHLVPLATIVTPNLPEAAELLSAEAASSREQMVQQAAEIRHLGPRWVLLKGGHLEDAAESVDILVGDGRREEYAARRIPTRNDHGTGCTLSAAIAALLPTLSITDSVRDAKAYLTAALAEGEQLTVGHGHGPLHHFHALWASERRS